MDLHEQLRRVQSREDLASFVDALHADLLGGGVDTWENPTLDRFLEALSGWCADMPGWFKNRGEPVPAQPNWNLVAQMMLAATVYE